MCGPGAAGALRCDAGGEQYLRAVTPAVAAGSRGLRRAAEGV